MCRSCAIHAKAWSVPRLVVLARASLVACKSRSSLLSSFQVTKFYSSSQSKYVGYRCRQRRERAQRSRRSSKEAGTNKPLGGDQRTKKLSSSWSVTSYYYVGPEQLSPRAKGWFGVGSVASFTGTGRAGAWWANGALPRMMLVLVV